MSGVELARWAVACPVWRWMPGMRTTEGALVVSCADGIPTEVVFDGALMPAVWAGRGVTLEVVHNGIARGSWYVLDGALPDLDDPATLGCIENALVPEAWGGDVFVSIDTHLTRDGRVRTVVIVDADGEPEPGEWAASTKAEALVLSLESAGRREVAP